MIFRNVPIAATRDRAYAYSLEVTAGGSSNITTRDLVISLQYLKADQTNTGTAISRTYDFADFINTSTGLFIANTERLNAPADAAYAQIVIQVAATTTNASSYVIDLYEVKLIPGQPMILVADRVDAATYGPGAMWKANGITSVDTDMPTSLTAGYGKLQISSAAVSVTSPFISSDAGTGIDAVLVQTGNLVVDDTSGGADQITITSTTAGSGLTIGGDTNLYRSAANTLKTDDSLQVVGLIATERASALDEALTARATGDATARFALYSNGAMEWGAGGARDLNLYRASAGLLKSDFALAATNISLSGTNGLRHDTPATTTQTSSAGIWVLVSGTNYQLRRNSSSARYKTNIVDADEVVLDAARKVKPRHYESTIEDENGATRLGFIAEEIHDAGLTHAVGYDAEGKPETIDPTALIAALWHRVSNLEDRLKALEEA